MSERYVPPAVRERIAKIVIDCVAKCNKHFGRIYSVPEVRYDLRGRVGGVAVGAERIRLNSVLLMENLEEYCTQVVPHEIAHCIDTANGDNQRPEWHMRRGRRLKRSIHGPTWKLIMTRIFGLTPDRCHQMDTTNAQVRVKTKFEYRCVCCKKPYFVSSVRHNKQRQWMVTHPGESYYNCVKCGRGRGKLVFVANRGQVSFSQAREAANAAAPTKEVNVTTLLPAAVPVYQAKPQATGNMAIAKAIFQEWNGYVTRGTFIRLAVERGLKATTASTYYAQLKRAP